MGVNHSTQGHGDRQRDLQPGAAHRPHRPRRRVAVLHHRPVQRHGHARSRLHFRACPGYRKFDNPRRPRRTRRALEHRRIAAARKARPGLSRHHRRRRRQEDPRAVDHRHQPAGLVSQPGRAAAGAVEPRFPGRAGRLPSDAHDRTRRPGAARRDLGRKGRHLHQLRAPRQQGEQGRRAARRSPLRFRHLPRRRRKARMPRRALPRLDRPSRTRSTNGAASRKAGCAITPASATNCWPNRARCSGRSPKARSRSRTSRLYADGEFQTRRWPRQADLRGLGAVSRAAQSTSIRSC